MKNGSVMMRDVVTWLGLPLLMACTSTYPHIEAPEDMVQNNESYDKTPIMLFVTEQSFFSLSATRGTGPFTGEDDTKNKLVNSTIYVYAFRNGQDAQGPLAGPADLTKTSYAENRTHDTTNESCLLDGPDYNLGMPMHPSAESGGALIPMWEGDLFYSSDYQDVGYNFFAYYLDDCKWTASRTSDRIAYDIEVDGTQDVLYGYAPLITSQMLNDPSKYGNLNIPYEDKLKILNANGYSTFAAHRDVHPSIDMQHVLARFRFMAYPGDKNANDIKITKVEMQAPYKGHLTVAGHTIDVPTVSFDEDLKTMVLRESNGDGELLTTEAEGISPKVVTFDEQDELIKDWKDREPTELGSSMLLPPAATYTLKLYYTQVMNGEEKSMTSLYRISAPKNDVNFDTATGEYTYKAGYLYDVKIAVFGLSPIEVTVNIAGWREGGSVDINPDDDPEIDITE